MGASLTLTKSLKGILIHLKLSPDVLGYDELLVHIPDYHLITKATTFNVVTISFHHQNKTINVVKMETCRGSCRGTFWHRRIRRASTIYQAETIIIPLMIKTTMMMMKFKVDDEVWVMIDIKVVG